MDSNKGNVKIISEGNSKRWVINNEGNRKSVVKNVENE